MSYTRRNLGVNSGTPKYWNLYRALRRKEPEFVARKNETEKLRRTRLIEAKIVCEAKRKDRDKPKCFYCGRGGENLKTISRNVSEGGRLVERQVLWCGSC